VLNNANIIIIHKMASAVSFSFPAFDSDYKSHGDDEHGLDEYDSIPNIDLYCPDFTLCRRPSKHTTCRITYSWNLYDEHEISISRPNSGSNMIPITQIDNLLDLNDICMKDIDIALGKRNKFFTFRDALETFATEVMQTYDQRTNMDTFKYTVPVSGFLSSNTNTSNFGINSFYLKKSESNIHTNTDFSAPREKFIIIDGEKYSTFKIYKYANGRYVPINISASYYPTPIVNEGEQTIRVAKLNCTKTSITYTLPTDTEMSGFSLHPESCQFDYVHTTSFKCHGSCTKKKHTIKYLKNDPGFLMSFKVFIRSSSTDGQWISLGTFSGNTSYNDSTRVSFDSIMVKEIRIVPIKYHKSFEKIQLYPIGPSITTNPTSDELFVTYSLMVPRDGKYMRRFSKVCDKFKGYTDVICNCGQCSGRRTGKGTYKEKCRNMFDMYDGFNFI
jgi:hypothetical protein